MWHLIFFASLALCFNFNVDSSIIAEPESDEWWSRNARISNLTVIFDSVIQQVQKMANAQNMDDMAKGMETFSRKFPNELLRDRSLKSMSTKFKKSYDELLKQIKPIVRTARSLEKMDKKRSQKELDAFALKMMDLNRHIEKFTKSVNDESEKQRNRNLKIMENNRSDVKMVENAKRFINLADAFSACIQWIQSIPSHINCFVFGNCEENVSDEADDSEDNGDEDDDVDEDVDEDDDAADDEDVDEGDDDANEEDVDDDDDDADDEDPPEED